MHVDPVVAQSLVPPAAQLLETEEKEKKRKIKMKIKIKNK